MFILDMMLCIPGIAKERIEKENTKVPWYNVVKLYIVLFYAVLSEGMPYKRAKYQMAYNKYTETIMYRERLIEFGPQFALEHFVENGEYNFFLTKLTRKDKLKALFKPFDYIQGL